MSILWRADATARQAASRLRLGGADLRGGPAPPRSPGLRCAGPVALHHVLSCRARSTFYCGLCPGLVVLILSAVTGTYWADPSGGSPTAYYLFAFLPFLALAGINVALVHSLMQALARLKQQDEQLGVINRELKHRIKNLFSIANCVWSKRSNPESRSTTCRMRSAAVFSRLLQRRIS